MLHEVEAPKTPLADRVEVVVLDWAGTTVDHGSKAPIIGIVNAFQQLGIEVSESEARRPMGRAKRDHLRQMLAQQELATRWSERFGDPPNEDAIDQVYEGFLKLQAECVVLHSAVIPGCVEAVEACRGRGVRIGSTTGYTRDLLERVAARARGEGYEPEVMLGADDIAPGRPAPWLCCEAARRLDASQMAAVVKVDDTPAGVLAGRHAGAWVVGVVQSGNEVGLTADELRSLSEEQRLAVFNKASKTLKDAGAHYLIDTIADLPDVVDKVNDRLASGARP